MLAIQAGEDVQEKANDIDGQSKEANTILSNSPTLSVLISI